MPYTVAKDASACSATKPWAVKNKNTGAVVPGGCHATKSDAIKHLGALESNVESARMQTDALVTIPNIQLIAVGSWKAMGSSPGQSDDVVFTEQDLVNIMASLEAPDVKEPRMTLGHTGPTEPASTTDGFYGEQPTIGKFSNLSLSADGQEITGDLVGVPQWLAAILPTAYPQRSVEVYWNVPSGIPGAAAHACVMPRIALLGVNLPAVATLDDLKVMYSEEGPEINPDLSKASRRIAASRGDAMPKRVAASVQYEDVRRDFYDGFATEESGRYWWWIKSVYVDPAILVVDDDEGGLWSVPYSTSEDETTFGEPVQIKVQYVEQETGKVAAGLPPGEQYAKAESRPTNRKKETAMTVVDVAKLRTLTGLTPEQLPDDATDEQVKKIIAEAADKRASAESDADPNKPDPAAQPPAGEPGTGKGDEAEADEDEDEDEGASAVVRVERGAWEETQAHVRELTRERDARNAESQTTYVKGKIREGVIPPSRKEHYVKLMEKDPEGTREFLDGLEATIPVEQRETGVGDDSEASKAASSDYDLSWLTPAERARVEAARAGQPIPTPRVVAEG